MPIPPAALMVAPVRPNAPKDGKTATLLEHAAEFGGYVAELENQNQAWRDWANSQAEVDSSEGARLRLIVSWYNVRSPAAMRTWNWA